MSSLKGGTGWSWKDVCVGLGFVERASVQCCLLVSISMRVEDFGGGDWLVLFVFWALRAFVVLFWRVFGLGRAHFLCCCKTPSM